MSWISVHNESPGTDGIPWEFFKNLPHNWILHSVSDSAITEPSSNILLFMLHKDGSAENSEKYRGLPMVNYYVKLSSSPILNRLYLRVVDCGVLPESQAGFRSGQGWFDHIFTLSSVTHQHIE